MFDHCLYFNTTVLARALEREWTKAFKPFGLTPSQAFMLRLILAKPALLQCELARELSISRPTATRTLDGLQKMKLIVRKDTARDGREYALYPTAKAQALKDQLNAASNEVTKRMKAKLGVSQFSDVVDRVKSIHSALS